MVELIKFGAEWCGPCRMIGPVVERLKEKYNVEGSDIQITTIDVDQNPEMAKSYKIQSIPAMVFKKDGEIISKKIGVISEKLIEDELKRIKDGIE